jgi:hypothetical protein
MKKKIETRFAKFNITRWAKAMIAEGFDKARLDTDDMDGWTEAMDNTGVLSDVETALAKEIDRLGKLGIVAPANDDDVEADE